MTKVKVANVKKSRSRHERLPDSLNERPSMRLLASLEELRTQGIPFEPLRALQPWSDNPRHNDENIVRVALSMQRFGWTVPILVRSEDGVIVAGHTRQAAALMLGLVDGPVVRRSLSEDDAKLVALADNRLTELSPWDNEALVRVSGEFDLDMLRITGFLVDDFNFLARQGVDVPAHLLSIVPLSQQAQGEADWRDEDVTTRVQQGDIWRLGSHRVLCGSSTDEAQVSRVLAGERWDGMWTDPPYGVAYTGSAGREDRDAIAGDESTETAVAALKIAITKGRPGASLYVAFASDPHLIADIVSALKSAARHQLVWQKNRFSPGRSDYQFGHEAIIYGWVPGGPHRWFGDRATSTLISEPMPRRSAEHPTMKPIGLITKTLGNSVQKGDLVYEPFAGSGSTLIACERLGVRCVAIECEPKYVDIIMTRFAAETGIKPELLSQNPGQEHK